VGRFRQERVIFASKRRGHGEKRIATWNTADERIVLQGLKVEKKNVTPEGSGLGCGTEKLGRKGLRRRRRRNCGRDKPKSSIIE